MRRVGLAVGCVTKYVTDSIKFVAAALIEVTLKNTLIVLLLPSDPLAFTNSLMPSGKERSEF